MDFEKFLSQSSSPSFWHDSRRICFTGPEYPLLFFAHFYKHPSLAHLPFARGTIADANSAKAAAVGVQLLRNQLSTSFLGQFFFYWLADISVLPAVPKKEMINFLRSYEGAHQIGFFVHQDDLGTGAKDFECVVQLPQYVNSSLFQALWAFLYPQTPPEKRSIGAQIFNDFQGVTIDMATLLIQYLELFPIRDQQVAAKYLAQVFESSAPLWTLSQHFFSKNASEFFAAWSKLGPLYPDVFWLAYWQEQLWRAYHTVSFLHENQVAKAHKMAYRLPSWMVKTDRHRFTPAELVKSFEFLYEIDYKTKTGSSFCSFDFFYHQYFRGTFAGN